MIRWTFVAVLAFVLGHIVPEISVAIADDVNDLAYLDECNPWQPHKNFPKLITPQWVGEDGVEAVVVLAIDDLRDTAKYEQYLRPILNRLKKIDGRAPVSLMTCDVKPDDPQLQSWLEEGLSIEVHTVDHPCPILQGGDFDKAKSTYDRCIDLLHKIPGNKPVAFRTPCCDSLNTVSPRFYSEIFNSTTPDGHSLQIDSSVFNFFTSEDESIPKELVLDNDGNERFWKYLPRNNNYKGLTHDNFVNYIKNYPYPYVINNSCWQFPCVAPSDWSAQHLHGVNNPLTVEDWKAALDITVHKQGVFNLVFHPHGWITAEQVVELIDHAVQKHGNKVKFLTFREAAERLNAQLTGGKRLSGEHRILDVDRNGYIDVVYGGTRSMWEDKKTRENDPPTTRVWDKTGWQKSPFPSRFQSAHAHGWSPRDVVFFAHPKTAKTAVFDPDPFHVDALADRQPTAWEFDGSWNSNQIGPPGDLNDLKIGWYGDGLRIRDFDGDGLCELLLVHDKFKENTLDDVRGQSVHELWRFEPASRKWTPSEAHVPVNPKTTKLTAIRFVDLNDDGLQDLLLANDADQEIWLMESASAGWTIPVKLDSAIKLLPISRNAKGKDWHGFEITYPTNNGFFIHDRHLCWQNEDTAHLPDLIHRVSFADILAEAARDEARRKLPPVPVGAAVVDITPKYPVRLTGYGNRATESEGVGAKIHARALVIGDDAKVLITVDNCGVPATITEAVYGKVAAKHNVSRERFAVSSTHTHSGPWLRDFAPNVLTNLPEEHAANLKQYEEDLIDKLTEVVDKAIAARKPGRLSLGRGKLGFAMNRRVLNNGTWQGFGETPDGPVDNQFPLLAAHDTEGKLIAVLANYACHATTETGAFNQISGDWPGFAADMIEADNPGAVALIAIGCGSDANPSPRGTHEQAQQHGRTVADEVKRLLGEAAELSALDPSINCNIARINLPLGPLPDRAAWEAQAKNDNHAGQLAKKFLKMLDNGEDIPTTVPNYPVQTWCFGEDLAMVFLGGEVVVDYSIRLNSMFDDQRLWINAYTNDVPCYIASKRILREGGYEADRSMVYYAHPTRLAPEAEDLICDAVQKLLPHEFYSDELQATFPGPKSPEDSLSCITVRPGMKAELVAAEPLIHDPVAFDWDVQGRMWVVEMGGYPSGAGQPRRAVAGQHGTAREGAESPRKLDVRVSGGVNGRVRVLTDADNDGRYDEAVTFLDDLNFPTGIHPWRNGWLITAAPDIIYAEDTDGDFKADVRKVLFTGFTEGNQQHRVNGMRWGLDGWLYLANGDSGGEIKAVATVSEKSVVSRDSVNIRGRDLRIHPDTGAIELLSGQTQFGRNRDDFGNWFGNNNSNPIWHYVLEDRYLSRNPHAAGLQTKAQVAEVPGAAPVFPTSKTMARFNDFHAANRFTSACSTSIYRDHLLGEEFYGNAFTCEPVHNLVSRLVLERDGVTFKGRRARDEQKSEFFASSDNWTRPVMVRTGPDGAIYIADMYRQVIEHPQWIPDEYQRKMNLRAGDDRGRIYRVTAGQPRQAVARPHGMLREEAKSPRTSNVRARSSNSPSREVAVTHAFASDREAASCCGFEAEAVNENQLHDSATSSDKVATAVPELRDWFNKPASEITTKELAERMASLNGWWRDTAQRLLAHRDGDFPPKELLTLMATHESAAVRVQAIAAMANVERTHTQNIQLAETLVGLRDDPHPEVRRQVLRFESRLRDEDEKLSNVLLAMLYDPSPIVQQQLALVMGTPDRFADASKATLASLLTRHGSNTHIRDAVYSSTNDENVVGLLISLSKSDEPVSALIYGDVLRMAAAFEKGPAVVAAFEALLKKMTEGKQNRSPDMWESAVGVSTQIRRNPKLTELVSQSKSTLVAWKNARQFASELSVSPDEDIRTRLAALNFMEVSGNLNQDTQRTLLGLFSPDTPPDVQQAAIRVLAAVNSDYLWQELAPRWRSLTPSVRGTAVEAMLSRSDRTMTLLKAIESGELTVSDVDAAYRQRLLAHKDATIREHAQKLFGTTTPSARTELVESLRANIADLKSDADAGKAVFEKRCATCHKIGEVGKPVGADLTALKDRSTDAMLTAILDPNKAVESKFFSYIAVTTEGRTFSGMLLNETGNSITLLGSDGKEQSVPRTDLDELVCSNKSLMPEGLEKDLTPQQLADVIAFVQSAGTTWKRFEGNEPRLVRASDDGTILLPASAAEIHGPNLVFESKHQNLGWWASTDDYAVWTIDVPRGGYWTVEVDYACDNGTAGGLLKLSTGTRLLTARIPGTGTWDDYRTWTAGKLDLGGGRRQIIVTAPEKPPAALLDLKAIRLLPPE